MPYFSYARVEHTVELMTPRWGEIVATSGALTDEQMLDSLRQAKKEGLDVVIPSSSATYEALHLLFMGEIESPSELHLIGPKPH